MPREKQAGTVMTLPRHVNSTTAVNTPPWVHSALCRNTDIPKLIATKNTTNHEKQKQEREAWKFLCLFVFFVATFHGISPRQAVDTLIRNHASAAPSRTAQRSDNVRNALHGQTARGHRAIGNMTKRTQPELLFESNCLARANGESYPQHPVILGTQYSVPISTQSRQPTVANQDARRKPVVPLRCCVVEFG